MFSIMENLKDEDVQQYKEILIMFIVQYYGKSER